jgi:hypothetical protein
MKLIVPTRSQYFNEKFDSLDVRHPVGVVNAILTQLFDRNSKKHFKTLLLNRQLRWFYLVLGIRDVGIQ